MTTIDELIKVVHSPCPCRSFSLIAVILVLRMKQWVRISWNTRPSGLIRNFDAVAFCIQRAIQDASSRYAAAYRTDFAASRGVSFSGASFTAAAAYNNYNAYKDAADSLEKIKGGAGQAAQAQVQAAQAQAAQAQAQAQAQQLQINQLTKDLADIKQQKAQQTIIEKNRNYYLDAAGNSVKPGRQLKFYLQQSDGSWVFKDINAP